MSTLNAKFDKQADGTLVVFFQGAIDEQSELEPIFSEITQPAVLNLREIERINSIGVHRWIPLITKLARTYKIVVEEISYPVVMQANCVANLFGSADVRSCLAPYFNPESNEIHMVLVTAQDVLDADGDVPEKRDNATNTVLEFDELDTYFSFLKKSH